MFFLIKKFRNSLLNKLHLSFYTKRQRALTLCRFIFIAPIFGANSFIMKPHIKITNTNGQILVLFSAHITSIREYTKEVSLITLDTGKEHYVPKPVQELIDEIFGS